MNQNGLFSRHAEGWPGVTGSSDNLLSWPQDKILFLFLVNRISAVLLLEQMVFLKTPLAFSGRKFIQYFQLRV